VPIWDYNLATYEQERDRKMASRHPYTSGPGAIVQVLDYLRRSFPTTFNSDTLKKLSIAPGNESYIINLMRFLNFINNEDSRTDEAHSLFTLHDDVDFQKAFSERIAHAYSDLFALHGDATWLLKDDSLIPFFRQTDKTSEVVGTRQATTFRTLASYAGHAISAPSSTKGDRLAVKSHGKAMTKTGTSRKSVLTKSERIAEIGPLPQKRGSNDVGLTVRIEINLPATGDQGTYDKIFKSIRENFLNA
jgi:hypothetical protein